MIFSIVLLLLFSASGSAWGAKGRAMVAQLAFGYLDEATKKNIIDMERFLRGAYNELTNFNGDYNDCPSYWKLKDLHKELTKKPEKPSSEA